MLFRGKRKSNWVGGWFYQQNSVDMFIYVIFVLTFLFSFFLFFMFVCLSICFFLVENFYVYFLEFNNCVCKFDKNKNKNLLKKKNVLYLLEANGTVIQMSKTP